MGDVGLKEAVQGIRSHVRRANQVIPVGEITESKPGTSSTLQSGSAEALTLPSAGGWPFSTSLMRSVAPSSGGFLLYRLVRYPPLPISPGKSMEDISHCILVHSLC